MVVWTEEEKGKSEILYYSKIVLFTTLSHELVNRYQSRKLLKPLC